ncbi:sporadically distributed protein [Mycobacteroides abscessus subsp. abscessus]|uniref:DUF6119 family protein n=1 Tax=Mycobacteroides abscessus TaxID=36809 RepID=UPI00092CDA5F|nr:DUF6119 family protein [Mycobacteroides abscessus]SIL04263.1 sporadically distributed protein [Mycobacteroides abscessus subsp. abscessus]SLE09263.1 sporadically distributed protein [Mycobacteroides abscessus subsp. abscessus]
MARKKPSATATTLYRLTDVTDLRSAIRQKYLNDRENFIEIGCSVADREALLVHGHMKTERARWADRLGTLIGQSLTASNQNAAAVLLIKGKESSTGDTGDPAAVETDTDDEKDTQDDSDGNITVWAVAYGMGFHLLDQAYVDPGFGQRIAIRTAHADSLNSLTSKTMDSRAKVDRSSIPSGSQLSGFGLGDFGELVTRVVATAQIEGLTVDKPFKVRGADALNLPLAHSPSGLLEDLALIERTLKKAPLKELQILEQLVALKKDNPTAAKLDRLLAAALLDAGSAQVGIAWPYEGVNENGTPASFRMKGTGVKTINDGVPSVEVIRQVIDSKNVLGSLNDIKVQLFSDPDGQSPISSDIPLRKWIAFEDNLDRRRYFLHDGLWYLMDDKYAAQLQTRVREIFSGTWESTLPPWKKQGGNMISEEQYNVDAAKHLGGWVLDRQLVTTTQNRRGFETCDILAPDGALVHVKKANASAPLSHLFAQGHNSAHSLMHDNEARAKFRKLVTEKGGNPDLVKRKPAAVVFAIARSASGKDAFDPGSLYSFSQVTLVRTVDDLNAAGIKVYVVPIDNDAGTS